MFKDVKQEYVIKTCASNDPELLEKILNSMSESGWELYTLHEVENNEGFQYNCIFMRDAQEQPLEEGETGFHSQMEKMFNSDNEPYELCISVQKKIKEKRQRIEYLKSLVDSNDKGDYLNEEIAKSIDELDEFKKQLSKILSPQSAVSKIGEERLRILLSEELYSLLSPDKEDNLYSQTVKVRDELAKELGYIMPKIKFAEDSNLNPYEFNIEIHGVSVLKWVLYPDSLMFYDKAVANKKNIIEEIDPISAKSVYWVEQKEAKDYWAEGLNAPRVLASILKEISIIHVDEILNYDDMNTYIELAGSQNSYLIENIIPDFLNVGELRYIFAQLLRERVSVKDIVYIFEKINDFSAQESKEDLVDKIRLSVSRQICNSLCLENNEIEVYDLSDSSLRKIEKEIDSDETIIRIDPSKFSEVIEKLEKIYLSLESGQNLILLAPLGIRSILYNLFSQFVPMISVIAPEETKSGYLLKIIDTI